MLIFIFTSLIFFLRWKNYIGKKTRKTRDVTSTRQLDNFKSPRQLRSYYDSQNREIFDISFPSSALFSAGPRDFSFTQRLNYKRQASNAPKFVERNFRKNYETKYPEESKAILPLQRHRPHPYSDSQSFDTLSFEPQTKQSFSYLPINDEFSHDYNLKTETSNIRDSKSPYIIFTPRTQHIKKKTINSDMRVPLNKFFSRPNFPPDTLTNFKIRPAIPSSSNLYHSPFLNSNQFENRFQPENSSFLNFFPKSSSLYSNKEKKSSPYLSLHNNEEVTSLPYNESFNFAPNSKLYLERNFFRDEQHSANFKNQNNQEKVDFPIRKKLLPKYTRGHIKQNIENVQVSGDIKDSLLQEQKKQNIQVYKESKKSISPFMNDSILLAHLPQNRNSPKQNLTRQETVVIRKHIDEDSKSILFHKNKENLNQKIKNEVIMTKTLPSDPQMVQKENQSLTLQMPRFPIISFPKFKYKFSKNKSIKRPPQIPGTARHPELSKIKVKDPIHSAANRYHQRTLYAMLYN